MDALGILPNETLPQIERIVRRQLSALQPNSDDFEMAAKLGAVERYATENLLANVKSAYMKGTGKWSSNEDALFLSYFLRTDPEFVKQLVARRVKQRAKNYESVFTAIAHVRVSAELANIAKDYIEYPDRKVAADAAFIFKWVGNADVERVLWKEVEIWNKEWLGRSESIPLDEQGYEDSLAEALLLGSGPCRLKETIERLRPLYIKAKSVDGNIEFPEWRDPVRIIANLSSPSGPKFQVDFCSGFLDLQQLKTALPRFPKETNFEWIGMHVLRTDPALDPVFNELESLAQEHAMSLRPYDDQ
jgi:hypothetical protein